MQCFDIFGGEMPPMIPMVARLSGIHLWNEGSLTLCIYDWA